MSSLSDDDLRARLSAFGFPVPPITDSTRRILEKKLAQLETAVTNTKELRPRRRKASESSKPPLRVTEKKKKVAPATTAATKPPAVRRARAPTAPSKVSSLVIVLDDTEEDMEVLWPCGHTAVRGDKDSCHARCEHRFGCRTDHELQCEGVCGSQHPHDDAKCLAMVEYVFPKCGHLAEERKPCWQEVTWVCQAEIAEKQQCGHVVKRRCNYVTVDPCAFPCEKVLKCGHACGLKCGQDCAMRECKLCLSIVDGTRADAEKRARAERKKEEKKVKDEIARKAAAAGMKEPFKAETLFKQGSDFAEYQMVEDQVMKFIAPCHNWVPSITMIIKVTNLILEEQFELARLNSVRKFVDFKFHGTSREACDKIVRDGFVLPTKVGMFGRGIYFATDSSKSAQNIYTKGSQILLMCRVSLGNSKVVDRADYSITSESLTAEGFDSVFAPRNTRDTGGVLNDEFVVYKPAQALPCYIIYYSNVSDPRLYINDILMKSSRFLKQNMKASRNIDLNDPFENLYRLAEWNFLRMVGKTHVAVKAKDVPDPIPRIESIDIVINKDLEDRFDAQRMLFAQGGVPDKEILAYHGTLAANVDNILRTNLSVSLAKRQLYGKGNYLSEFPDVSIGYGAGLLLCRVLPGNEFENYTAAEIPSGFHSKKVLPDAARGGCGLMHVVENSDQILPCFVIHLQK